MGKLISSLQRLSPKQFKRFSLFIQSPYFCQHEDTRLLLDLLRDHFPDFKLDLFDSFRKERSEVFSKTKFNLTKSYLLGHLNDFLTIEAFKENKVEFELKMVDALRENGAFSEAKKKAFGVEKRLSKQLWSDYHFDYQTQLRCFQFDLQLHTQMKSEEKTLKNLFLSLEDSFTIRLLKYNLADLSFGNLIGSPYSSERWNSILEKVGVNVEDLPPLSRIYFILNKALIEKDVDAATLAKKLLDKHQKQIDPVEKINAYGYLLNYWGRAYSRGVKDALENLFHIYQIMSKQNLLVGRGEISGNFLRNLTIVSCRTGNEDWVANFFHENQDAIERDVGMNVYAFSLAYLFFYQGNYEVALRHLQELEFADQFYRTGHQVLLLRIYYELNEFEALETLSRTFRRYLNRAKDISEELKDMSRNFLSILHLLVKVKEKGSSRKELDKISGILAEEKRITDRTWLGEKLEELKQA